MKPEVSYDPNVQAIYVRLSTKKYHHGHDLDEDRRIDYAKDGTPIGVELLGADEGIRLDGLPNPEAILEALTALAVPILDVEVRGTNGGSPTRAPDPAATAPR